MDAPANSHINVQDGHRDPTTGGPRVTAEPQALLTGRALVIIGQPALPPNKGVQPAPIRPAQGEITFTLRRLGFTPNNASGSHVVIVTAPADPGQLPGGQRPLAPRRRVVRRIPGQWDAGTEVDL